MLVQCWMCSNLFPTISPPLMPIQARQQRFDSDFRSIYSFCLRFSCKNQILHWMEEVAIDLHFLLALWFVSEVFQSPFQLFYCFRNRSVRIFKKNFFYWIPLLYLPHKSLVTMDDYCFCLLPWRMFTKGDISWLFFFNTFFVRVSKWFES